MSVSTIATRYAKSLIDLANDRGELEAVFSDVKGLKEAIKNRDFYLLLKSPIVKTDKKLSIFKAIFSKNANPLTMGFVELMTKKGRENILPEITDEFMKQYKSIKNISSVKIKTATPMSASILDSIKSKLESSDATRMHVEIDSEVDERLIGGFILEIEDRLYDASVAHKLEGLRKEFTSNK